MKKIPQRDYTRNGTIFKTVDGVRKKFGLRMTCHFKFSNDIEVTDYINLFYNFRNEEQIRLCNESGYVYAKELESIGFVDDDFIHNNKTIQIRFIRLFKLTDIFQLLNT